jgi:uncharacterized membrane protein YfcA
METVQALERGLLLVASGIACVTSGYYWLREGRLDRPVMTLMLMLGTILTGACFVALLTH